MAFNEKFGFERPDQLKEEYKKGLIKGLPFPILTVAEYIAVDAFIIIKLDSAGV